MTLSDTRQSCNKCNDNQPVVSEEIAHLLSSWEAICAEGDALVWLVTETLTYLGSRDFEDSGESAFMDFYETMVRGAHGKLGLFSNLVGKYVLCLWIVKSWLSRCRCRQPDSSYLVFQRGGSASAEIDTDSEDWFLLQMQWWWIDSFVAMAKAQGIYDLSMVPAPYNLLAEEELEKDDPAWMAIYTALVSGQHHFPYHFDLSLTDSGYRINVELRTVDPETLIRSTVRQLESLSAQIRALTKTIINFWERLTSKEKQQDELTEKAIHQARLTHMEFWPEAFRNDQRLFDAATARIFTGNLRDPLEKKRREELLKSLEKLQKDSCGYGRGYRTLPETELDDNAKALIKNLYPDLRKLMGAVWPLGINPDEKEKTAKAMSWTFLSAKDLEFVWKFKDGDREGFCARVIYKYLKRITEVEYGLNPIRSFIKPFIQSLPRSKRESTKPPRKPK